MNQHYWIQLSSGQGPIECEAMVVHLRSYLTDQAIKLGLCVSTMNIVPGKITGTAQSILLRIDGNFDTLATLQQWEGTAQWIWHSTFRPAHKRKNWFAGIRVLPAPENKTFDFSKLKIETMHASGPGGQSVNTSNTAVRITYLPSGLSIVAREERSQLRNRQLALARLCLRLEEEQAKSKQNQGRELWTCHHNIERGNPVLVFRGSNFLPDASR